MARDRRNIADKEGAARTAASASASPVDNPLAGNCQAAQHPGHQNVPARDLFHHFLRTLARDAARRDHAADPD